MFSPPGFLVLALLLLNKIRAIVFFFLRLDSFDSSLFFGWKGNSQKMSHFFFPLFMACWTYQGCQPDFGHWEGAVPLSSPSCSLPLSKWWSGGFIFWSVFWRGIGDALLSWTSSGLVCSSRVGWGLAGTRAEGGCEPPCAGHSGFQPVPASSETHGGSPPPLKSTQARLALAGDEWWPQGEENWGRGVKQMMLGTLLEALEEGDSPEGPTWFCVTLRD